MTGSLVVGLPRVLPSRAWPAAVVLREQDVAVVYDMLRALCSRTHMPLSIGLAGFDGLAGPHGRGVPPSDEFLGRAFSGFLKEARASDLLMRRADGTFLLIMPNTSLGGGVRTMDKMRQAAQRRASGLAGGGVPTLSAGVVEADAGDPLSLEKSLDETLAHLARARAEGGDRIVPGGTGRAVQENLVLLAEEDPLVAPIIIRSLHQADFEVRHATDGAEALAAAIAHPARLVILDAHLTHLNGYELLGRLRGIPAYQRTPIIMLSAMSSEKDVSRGLSLGASDFLAKPFSTTELMARTRRLLKVGQG